MIAPAATANQLLSYTSMTPDYHTTLSAVSSGYRSLYLDRTDLDLEDVRLQTFLLWPKWAPKSLSKEDMAKFGLYFTGDNDSVKCFRCKMVLGGWKDGDRPLDRHRQVAPQCEFLAGLAVVDEDDLVVDGEEDERENEEDEDDEDCVDGAIAEVRSISSSLQHDFEHHLSLSDTASCISNGKETQNNKSQIKYENEKLRKAMICRQCKTERIQTLFLPCRHLVTCEECADKMDFCIECHERILGTVRTFMV